MRALSISSAMGEEVKLAKRNGTAAMETANSNWGNHWGGAPVAVTPI